MCPPHQGAQFMPPRHEIARIRVSLVRLIRVGNSGPAGTRHASRKGPSGAWGEPRNCAAQREA
jgi:hypothetical protein